MVSLLARVTARGMGVPVLDRRLRTHVQFRVDDNTNEGPAAPAEVAPAEAPAQEQTSDANANDAE